MKSFLVKSAAVFCGGALCMAAWAGLAQTQFASPEEAAKALTAAAQAKDHDALNSIFGPELRALVSPDAVQSSNRFDTFARRMAEKVYLTHPSDDKVTLEIGHDRWPFPIPVVRRGGHWLFDTAAGREEILNRRIGGNELGAIRVCHSYVDAQREYAEADRMNDGVLQYAQHLRSDTNQHNGLYWHAAPGEEVSPFGPLIAAAHGEGYHKATKILTEAQSPYHGYFFKILTRQGKHAAGGKYSYIINGRMIAGFALVAWPAQWGNSGIMTFMVNQQGKIFEKNLGPKTAEIAPAMGSFDPDSSWKPAWEP